MKDKILRRLLFGEGSSLPSKTYPCHHKIGMKKDGVEVDHFYSTQGVIYNLCKRVRSLELKLQRLNDSAKSVKKKTK